MLRATTAANDWRTYPGKEDSAGHDLLKDLYHLGIYFDELEERRVKLPQVDAGWGGAIGGGGVGGSSGVGPGLSPIGDGFEPLRLISRLLLTGYSLEKSRMHVPLTLRPFRQGRWREM